ncbi:MAG: HEAT repeat domain-containing protein [Gemmatimonadetes bacterium]|nr:HEAT repeat domain-containing protein [Gemmatimonadota bacterium]
MQPKGATTMTGTKRIAGRSEIDEHIADWVRRFVRALKTCRLYDSENPAVIHAREHVSESLLALLPQCGGEITLTFRSESIFHVRTSVYEIADGEENPVLAFFRDGVRSIKFLAGVTALEIDSLFDQILIAAERGGSDADLAILIWDHDLPHIRVECVPVATEGGIEERNARGGGPGLSEPLTFWPRRHGEGEPGGGVPGDGNPGGGTAPPVHGNASPGGDPSFGSLDAAAAETTAIELSAGRSDDWMSLEKSGDVEVELGRLEAVAERERARFLDDRDEEQKQSLSRSALETAALCVEIAEHTGETADGFAPFVPRILIESVRCADWTCACECLRLLRTLDPERTAEQSLFAELSADRGYVTTQCVELLDAQPATHVEKFFTFAHEVGEGAVEWLMRILAQSEQKEVRRPLTRVIADICRSNPGLLRQWLVNPEWFVVRNVIHICGWIGAEDVTDLLQLAMEHPEPRVRQEVIAALGHLDPGAARPLLLRMLSREEGHMLGAVLHQLLPNRDPAVSRILLRKVTAPSFAERPREEREEVFSALAQTGSKGILPLLRNDLMKGGWDAWRPNARRKAIADCLAGIGTEPALEILRAGARTWRPGIRFVCRNAIAKGPHHE